MTFLRTSFLVVLPALLLVGVSGCDGNVATGSNTVMALAKATPAQQQITVTNQAVTHESCTMQARFVPGVGCENRRPAMPDPELDQPSCEVGSLDHCMSDCEGGGAFSCGVLSKMYREGIGVRRDIRVAQKWQRRACALGGIEGCEGPSKS